MIDAWNFVSLSLSKMIAIFNRLFSAFNLGEIILTVIFLSASVHFLIMPLLRREGSSDTVKKIFSKKGNSKKDD